MKKILFPTDFSKTSENAFRYALNVAKQLGASISTVHAYTAPAVVSAPTVMAEEMADLSEKYEIEEYETFNKKLLAIAKEEEATEVTVDHTLEYGLAVDEVVKKSSKENYDLIIMGTNGAEGLGKWLIGSHAASVVSKANCPVLVLPDDAKYRPVKRIAYATNFEDVDDNILNDLLEWVGRFNAELHFVHVTSKGEYIDSEQYANMAEISELADRYENVKFKILYDRDVLEELEDYVEDEYIDILVMVTHRYNFFKRLFQPSLTKQMAFEAEMPLLVYKAPNN
jgi:nucleotide-binding universal stress UspA family protein